MRVNVDSFEWSFGSSNGYELVTIFNENGKFTEAYSVLNPEKTYSSIKFEELLDKYEIAFNTAMTERILNE